MPIVFIHAGYSPYLEFSLRQAQEASPESEIVLLGDADNDRFPFVTHVDAASGVYAEAAREIANVYQHRSTNGVEFERVCFERWFRLRAWFEVSGAERALVLDSDVLLYAPETEVLGAYGAAPLAISLPEDQERYRWIASPHATVWTSGAVVAFCDSILEGFESPEAYEQKWAHHRQTGTPGGVCDMTALFLFAQNRAAANVADGRDGVCFEHNLNTAENRFHDEYAMRDGLKAIHWDGEGRPWGQNLRLGREVRFFGLHLQGQAKGLIPEYYRGPTFKGAHRQGAALRRYYSARRVAGRVKTALWRGAGRLRGLTGGGS